MAQPFAPIFALPDADDFSRIIQFVPESVDGFPVDGIPRLRRIDAAEKHPFRQFTDIAMQNGFPDGRRNKAVCACVVDFHVKLLLLIYA